MKKTLFLLIGLTLGLSISAQKFAIVDTDYILKNIPAYEAAQEQLNIVSEKWQKEVEDVYKEVASLYKNYQTESVFLSNEMKVKKENEIIEKEKAAKALQQKYFGQEGELFKKRELLIKPIQDDIYNAVKELSSSEGYAVIFDKAAGLGMLYVEPKTDVSDEVLEKLGVNIQN